MAGGGPSRTLGHGGGLSPYHVGVRGGHDVGVGAVGAHGVPQRGEPCRGVGGRGGQVLVVGAFWRWCFFFFFFGVGALHGAPWGVWALWGLTGGSTEQFRMSVQGEAACCECPGGQAGVQGEPRASGGAPAPAQPRAEAHGPWHSLGPRWGLDLVPVPPRPHHGDVSHVPCRRSSQAAIHREGCMAAGQPPSCWQRKGRLVLLGSGVPPPAPLPQGRGDAG